LDKSLQNPCDSPILRKMFRTPKKTQWKILEKEIVDEIIFRTRDPRNRLILELMARGGMRIGEVLNIKSGDVDERKIFISEPKSGRETEAAFIPQKTAQRLKDYIKSKDFRKGQRVFPITYPAARMAVMQAGELVGIYLRPHDLRRHSATYASRSGTPIEIVSKVILRHSNLSTTQRYLGKVSDLEAMRWIENLYG
jgi:integrase/recombinase XerD